MPVLFVLPEISDLLAAPLGQPMPLLFKIVIGSPGGGFGMLFLILGIALFAGVGALTASCESNFVFLSATSGLTLSLISVRCTWAFSRDGAIPFSNIWSKVNHRYDIPIWALVLSTVVDCLLGLIYLGSSAGRPISLLFK